MKTILIPTDFSENGTDAYAYAEKLVGTEEAHFHIVNVVVPITQSIEYHSTASVANTALINAARNSLATLEALQQKEGFVKSNIKVTTNILLGRVAESIIRESKQINADLIIMGTTGKGRTNLEKFLGSASSDVISNSKIPVLLIPKGYHFRPIDNLVFATDLDKSALFSIWKLSKILSPNTATIQCLQVTDKESKIHDENIKEFSHFLKENSSSFQTHFHVENSKDIEAAISDFADNYGAKMIVMHKTTKNFWVRFFGPKHTKRMSYQLEIPLLII